MPPQPLGPFHVLKGERETGINVHAGDHVRVVSSGLIDFGGAFLGQGAPKLDANGDSDTPPADYPEPALRKNSLICRVGPQWYQGGTDTSFTPGHDGELVLRANDRYEEDNSRGWTVTVWVLPRDEITVESILELSSAMRNIRFPIFGKIGG